MTTWNPHRHSPQRNSSPYSPRRPAPTSCWPPIRRASPCWPRATSAWPSPSGAGRHLALVGGGGARRDGERGRVDVGCGTDEEGAVRIHVRDTGIGIPPEKLATVFEPFVQVVCTLTRTQQGTGLGLAISRDLARGMDGDLTVESTPGVGSIFTLTLPRAPE
ncbi:MAG: hypothetical protein ICV87_09785 [Gemmatimonadetes bacterium]|nr:hypothetical protein [Gemmatimonadota bacterium]